jgi:hypothetical protein
VIPRAAQSGIAARLPHPKTTVRWRLTLLYGGLFLACGAALLTITYTLVDHATISNTPFRVGINPSRLPPKGPRPSFERASGGRPRNAGKRALPSQTPAKAKNLRRAHCTRWRRCNRKK